MLPKPDVVIFLLAIIAVTLKTGEAGKEKPNGAPIPPPKKPATANTTTTTTTTTTITTPTTTEDTLKAPSKINKYVLPEEAPYTTINISWTGEKNAKNINYIVILIYPHNELGWLPMQEMKNDEHCCYLAYTYYGKQIVGKLIIRAADGERYRYYDDSVELPLLNHAKSQFLNLRILEYNDSTVKLEWHTTCGLQFDKTEIKSHLLTSTKRETLRCKFYNNNLAECKVAPQPQVLQLFASDHNGKLVGHSEPVFLWPEEQEDKLILERREPNSVSVNVNIKEPINYTLSIYAYPNETAEEVIKDTSDRRKFPFTVQLRKKAVSYRFELLFETRDYYSRETVSYLLEEEGLPNEVEGAEIKAVTSEYSPTEHATFRVTWLPPSEPAGMIQKYKIRWKLERSPYTIYAEERCNITEYDLRLYWAEERYQVFISAATSKGYGPEKRLDVAIGSPPDWIYRPKNVTTSTEPANVTEPSIKRLDRRKFEAQLRAEIGHEYQVGRTRVLISIVFLLICLAFAYFLKTVVLFAPFPDVNRRGRNRRRRRRRKRSASKD
ncbi:hypothetical protein Q1695_013953 [Nippostrongylus brasiliensis]|nr:hypothetical protein Q1695_013953 [Nippostrongylus brasiliensis]